jgi:hypothetical protein
MGENKREHRLNSGTMTRVRRHAEMDLWDSWCYITKQVQSKINIHKKENAVYLKRSSVHTPHHRAVP